jgi:hypothetical protein
MPGGVRGNGGDPVTYSMLAGPTGLELATSGVTDGFDLPCPNNSR